MHLKFWQTLTIKKKIVTFAVAAFGIYLLSILFNAWVIHFSLGSLSPILKENSQSVRLVQTLEQEILSFESYVQRREVTKSELDKAVAETKKAVYELPFSYKKIGESRYALTWSIHNSYEVYTRKRDAFLMRKGKDSGYIQELYELYDMQKYLLTYAEKLMADTMESGSASYEEKIRELLNVPVLMLFIGCGMVCVLIRLAKMMNDAIILPIMKLVSASKQIADNTFFIADIEVENQDEIGELVHAFNKMKYATGEYITALEEKRKTLDLLHEEEIEKLEAENQLESMKFELLKNQINPHFLFNTLNVIGGMAVIEEAPVSEKMIKALSGLFRYNLKTDDMEVPLARELKVVEDYMYLQQMRFGERIRYDILCNVDKTKVYIPTFTFQPLVENAIIHGLSHKEAGGKVRIRISQRENILHIAVGDTGNGMDAETLSKVRAGLKEPGAVGNPHHGIGTGNIYRRIIAMYSGSHMDIYSKKDVGTVVKLGIQKVGAQNVSDTNSG